MNYHSIQFKLLFVNDMLIAIAKIRLFWYMIATSTMNYVETKTHF